jgi:hypothetical protein
MIATSKNTDLKIQEFLDSHFLLGYKPNVARCNRLTKPIQRYNMNYLQLPQQLSEECQVLPGLPGL